MVKQKGLQGTYRNVVIFASSSAFLSKNTYTTAVIKNKSPAVFFFQFHNFRERSNVSKVVVKTFNDNESSCNFSVGAFIFHLNFLQNSLEIFHVVMIEPMHITTGKLDTSLNSIVATFITKILLQYLSVQSNIHNKNITTTRKSINNTGNGDKTIRVHHCVFSIHKFLDSLFKFQVSINCTTKSSWPTCSSTISLNSSNSCVLYFFC